MVMLINPTSPVHLMGTEEGEVNTGVSWRLELDEKDGWLFKEW